MLKPETLVPCTGQAYMYINVEDTFANPRGLLPLPFTFINLVRCYHAVLRETHPLKSPIWEIHCATALLKAAMNERIKSLGQAPLATVNEGINLVSGARCT